MAAHIPEKVETPISETVETLTVLVHDNVAVADRLRDATEVTDDEINRQMLESMAEIRQINAEELQAHAATFGRVPDVAPTLTDKLGRAMSKIRGVVTNNETETVLEGAAGSEVDLRDGYYEAIASNAVASSVKDVLTRHVDKTVDYPTVIRQIERDEHITDAARQQS
ncbi:MAG: hypothetical protein ACI8P0_002007 [Planctomycetaceae bacterium]|jgi:uncharacterized protein (TIGR02284 family)